MIDFEALRLAMADRQVRPADIRDPRIVDAMLAVPRELFVPRASRAVAYADAPIPIAPGRFMPEPRTLAKLLDALAPAPGDLLLAVGAGLGYGPAIAARLAAAVVALEEDEGLAAQAAANLASLGADNVIVERGRLVDGAPGSGPYDAILLEGGVATEPAALLAQLKEGGRLAAIWLDGPAAWCRVWLRSGGALSSRRAFDAPAALLPGFDCRRQFAL